MSAIYHDWIQFHTRIRLKFIGNHGLANNNFDHLAVSFLGYAVLCCAMFPHQINSQRVIIDFACGKSINFPNRAKLFDGPMKHWQSIVWMPVLKQSIYAARSVKNQVVQYFLFNNKAWAIYSLKSTPNTYTHKSIFMRQRKKKKQIINQFAFFLYFYLIDTLA